MKNITHKALAHSYKINKQIKIDNNLQKIMIIHKKSLCTQLTNHKTNLIKKKQIIIEISLIIITKIKL